MSSLLGFGPRVRNANCMLNETTRCPSPSGDRPECRWPRPMAALPPTRLKPSKRRLRCLRIDEAGPPAFNSAKRDALNFEACAEQLVTLFKGNRKLLEEVLDGLFHIAKANGEVHRRGAVP